MSARSARLLVAAVAIVGVGLDQVTKYVAVAQLDPANPPVLLGGLVTLRLIRNPGAAFSLGGDRFTVVFTLLAVAATIGVLGWLVPKVRTRLWAVTAGLLLAGIIGNLIDRLFREPGFGVGHVVDFVQLPYFAIFNVADVCLTTAAAIIIITSLAGGAEPSGRVAADRDRPVGADPDEALDPAPPAEGDSPEAAAGERARDTR